MDLEHSRMELPPNSRYVEPALCFIDSYVSQFGVTEDRKLKLKEASRAALSLVMENNQSDSNSRVGVEVFEEDGSIIVEVVNQGVPIFLHENGGRLNLHQLSKNLDRLSVENLGRHGQTLVLGLRLAQDGLEQATVKKLSKAEASTALEEITIREMLAGEEEALSQLFYHVYGYNYIHDYVYFPEKIRALRTEGKLICLVAALPNGRLIGNVGIMRVGDSPAVYEPCLGVVDPRLKSQGLFSKLFQKTMDHMNAIDMHYSVFDFVTNHDLSQRFVSRFGTCDLALYVGCQSKDTQAKLSKLGIGEDSKEMDRYTLLVSMLPRVKYPFGREVLLPNNIGELIGFLLGPIGVTWSPTSRFQVLPPGGEYKTLVQPAQNAVIFDLKKPGRQAVDQILKDWNQLLKDGYEYAGVDVPLTEVGLGNLYDILAKHGFFISGFVPYHYSGTLGIRMQSIGPTKVAWDDIRVFAPHARRLLQVVRTNYERNTHL